MTNDHEVKYFQKTFKEDLMRAFKSLTCITKFVMNIDLNERLR